jgi:transposase
MTVTDHLSALELQQWGRRQHDGRVVRRLQVVVLAQKRHSGARIAELTGFSPRSVRRIVQRYNKDGPVGLADRPRPGQPRKLASEREQAFCARLEAGATDADAVTTLHGWNIQRILKDEFEADYSLNGVYALMHRMNYSWLMPRPQHEHADAQAQEDFKKTLTRKSRPLRPSIPANALKYGSRTKRVSVNKAR